MALPRGPLPALPGGLGDLRSRWWALVPALSIVVVIVAVNFYEGSATFLTYLALFAVPPLAALALGLLVRGARPALSVAAVPLFALAWALPGTRAGPRSPPRIAKSRALRSKPDFLEAPWWHGTHLCWSSRTAAGV